MHQFILVTPGPISEIFANELKFFREDYLFFHVPEIDRGKVLLATKAKYRYASEANVKLSLKAKIQFISGISFRNSPAFLLFSPVFSLRLLTTMTLSPGYSGLELARVPKSLDSTAWHLYILAILLHNVVFHP